MITTDVCSGGKQFEWRGKELFIVSHSVTKDTAWIDSYVMENIRKASIGHHKDPNIFIIDRSGEGDKVFVVGDEVGDAIMFAGGDMLYFIKPMMGH